MMRRLLPALLLFALGCSDDAEPTPPAGPAQEAPPAPPPIAFVEGAKEAGIDFRMRFLEGEQGENFKINLYDHGSGVAVADYDGDGDDDIYLLNQLGPNALYRNDGKGRFTDVTAEAGPLALADRICVFAVFNDVDGDGDQDLYVTSTRGGNVFLRNTGQGRFVDATEEAGLAWVGHCQSATFFDADGDGDLDLLLTNTARWTTETLHGDGYYTGAQDIVQLILSPVETNVFYTNDGDGTFTDATEESGLKGEGWGGDTAVLDYDDDGDQDVFVGNMFGRSVLYGNDGKGRFEDVTREVLGKTPFGTVGAKVFDYDGDGRLDLYVVDMHSDMWMPAPFDLGEIEEQKKYPRFFGPRIPGKHYPIVLEDLFNEKYQLDVNRVFYGNGL